MDLILLTSIACLLLALAIQTYFILRNRSQIKKLKQHLLAETEELKKSRDKETQLHQELSSVQDKLQMATEDTITNLLVWPLFEDRFNHAIKESTRYQFTLGLLFIDIDDFKMINNALSPEMGNVFLRETAKRLQSCIRQVDSITRYGKDTFVVLLAQLGKPETAAIVAQRMLQTLAQPIQIKDQEFFITAAIGIAIFPTDGQDSASLFKNADDALHVAKQKGKHLYQFYQEKININSQRELIMATSLRKETLYQEFSIHYQPVMNKKNNTILSMDTVLHWQHPELGLINTRDLFANAEKQHKLNNISEWLIKKSCQHFKKWRESGVTAQFLGVPLFCKQLENSQFVYRFSQILQEEKFNPEWLLVEIKNHDADVDFAELEKSINMLKYQKINLLLDDIGVNAIHLQQIKYFSPNYLRLHYSLLEDADGDNQAIAILKSMLQLAGNLGLSLIAQGVETPQQMMLLQTLGYELMQGDAVAATLAGNEVAVKILSQ